MYPNQRNNFVEREKFTRLIQQRFQKSEIDIPEFVKEVIHFKDTEKFELDENNSELESQKARCKIEKIDIEIEIQLC